jgi:hypothetical protein
LPGREVHIVDDLQANLLVGIDILGPEGFVLDPRKGTAYIRSSGNHAPFGFPGFVTRRDVALSKKPFTAVFDVTLFCGKCWVPLKP